MVKPEWLELERDIMASSPSTLAWRTLGQEEPSGLGSIGLHKVGHDQFYLPAAAVIN